MRKVGMWMFIIGCFLCNSVTGQDYNTIDAITAASNKGKGDFKIEGGKAYADRAELYVMFTEKVREGSSKGFMFLKYGVDTTYSKDSMNMAPIEKEELAVKTLSGLDAGTTYYYRIYGEHVEDGEEDWLEVKSSFVTFGQKVHINAEPAGTADKRNDEAPGNTALPSPNSSFRFSVPGRSYQFEGSFQQVTIYNLSGAVIKRVPTEHNSAAWNGLDRENKFARSGLYLVELVGDGGAVVGNFVLTE